MTRWFNDKLEQGQKSDPSKAHKEPLVYNITSAQAMPTMLTDALPGFDIAPDVRPATLVLSVNSPRCLSRLCQINSSGRSQIRTPCACAVSGGALKPDRGVAADEHARGTADDLRLGKP